jgi:flagellar motility protein MotE (MotC chaperone)
MSKMIKLLSVAVILFSVAASGSWYLQSQMQKKGDDDHGDTPKAAKATSESSSHGGGHAAAPAPAPAAGHGNGAKPAATAKPHAEPDGPRPLPRPMTTMETDRITQMAASLQLEKAGLKKREDLLQSREKSMELIHQEVVKEHKKLDSLRKEIHEEYKAVEERLAMAEKRILDSTDLRQKVEAEKEKLKDDLVLIGNVEAKSSKQLAAICEKMEPEAAAQAIAQMVDTGKLDVAAQILVHMSNRSAAALLTELSKVDSDITGRLVDRMRHVKTSTASPKEKQ